MTTFAKRISLLIPIFLLFFCLNSISAQAEPKKALTKEEIEKQKATGVKEIIVETKEEAVGKEKPVGPLGDSDRPEFVLVDGQEFNPEKLNEIDPSTIANVKVLKGKQAKALDPKYKKGVIVITLKKQ